MLSPSVARRLIRLVAGDADAADGQRARDQLARLTERGQEVAEAVGQGRSNAEIAGQLHMSVATVKAHVSRMLVKLDAGNRVQIALLVRRAGRAASSPPPAPGAVR